MARATSPPRGDEAPRRRRRRRAPPARTPPRPSASRAAPCGAARRRATLDLRARLRARSLTAVARRKPGLGAELSGWRSSCTRQPGLVAGRGRARKTSASKRLAAAASAESSLARGVEHHGGAGLEQARASAVGRARRSPGSTARNTRRPSSGAGRGAAPRARGRWRPNPRRACRSERTDAAERVGGVGPADAVGSRGRRCAGTR